MYYVVFLGQRRVPLTDFMSESVEEFDSVLHEDWDTIYVWSRAYRSGQSYRYFNTNTQRHTLNKHTFKKCKTHVPIFKLKNLQDLCYLTKQDSSSFMVLPYETKFSQETLWLVLPYETRTFMAYATFRKKIPHD